MSEPLGTKIKNFFMSPEQRKQLREAFRSRSELKKKLKKAKSAKQKANIIRKHSKKN